MPHKVGEEYRPGAMDEKIRAEAANYAFVGEKCADIPVPHLAGFGLSNDQQVGKSSEDLRVRSAN